MIEEGNKLSIDKTTELASCRIKLCDLKLTVKYMISLGDYNYNAFLQYYLLKINLRSSNLKETPFVIACAVSPQ